MVETAIEKFDPSTLADKVRARLRETIADLIPEEQWKKLVANEIDVFLHGERPSWNGGSRGPSPVRPLVDGELRRIFLEKIKATLASDDWKPWIGEHEKSVGPMLAEIIKDAAPGIIVNLLTNGVSNALGAMGAHLQNQIEDIKRKTGQT